MIINVIVYTLPWRTRTLVATNEPPLLARKESGVISTYNRVTIIYIYILLPFRAHFFFFFFFNSRRITERRWSIDRSETQAKNRANPLLQLPRFPSNIYIYIPNIARPENVKRLFCTTDKETIFVFSRVNLVHVHTQFRISFRNEKNVKRRKIGGTNRTTLYVDMLRVAVT